MCQCVRTAMSWAVWLGGASCSEMYWSQEELLSSSTSVLPETATAHRRKVQKIYDMISEINQPSGHLHKTDQLEFNTYIIQNWVTLIYFYSNTILTYITNLYILYYHNIIPHWIYITNQYLYSVNFIIIYTKGWTMLHKERQAFIHCFDVNAAWISFRAEEFRKWPHYWEMCSSECNKQFNIFMVYFVLIHSIKSPISKPSSTSKPRLRGTCDQTNQSRTSHETEAFINQSFSCQSAQNEIKVKLRCDWPVIQCCYSNSCSLHCSHRSQLLT